MSPFRLELTTFRLPVGGFTDGLVYKTVCSEGKEDDSVASDWMAYTLPALLSEYESWDVLNTEEAGSETMHALDLHRAASLCTASEGASAKFNVLQKGLLGNMEVG